VAPTVFKIMIGMIAVGADDKISAVYVPIEKLKISLNDAILRVNLNLTPNCDIMCIPIIDVTKYEIVSVNTIPITPNEANINNNGILRPKIIDCIRYKSPLRKASIAILCMPYIDAKAIYNINNSGYAPVLINVKDGEKTLNPIRNITVIIIVIMNVIVNTVL
jgi:hypothetical protein